MSVTTPSHEASPNEPDGARRGRPRRRTLLVVAVIGLAVLGGWYGWTVVTAASPPDVELGGLDPAIRRTVIAADRWVRWFPGSSRAWGHLGMVLWAHEFNREAMMSLAHAEGLDAHDPRWPYLQGVILSEDDPAAALLRLKRAVQLCGNEIGPRLRLGRMLVEQGDLAAAGKQYADVMQIEPAEAHAALGLGRIAALENRPQQALDRLNFALGNANTRKTALLLSAEINARLGQIERSRQLRGQAEQLPDDAPFTDPYLVAVTDLRVGWQADWERAKFLIEQERPGEAVSLMRRVVRTYPDLASVWILLGWAETRNKDPQAAEASLRRALALEPKSVEALVHLGVALADQGEGRAAIDLFREALQLRPTATDARLDLGICLLGQGENNAALDAFETLAQQRPGYLEAYIGQAEANIAIGHFEEAHLMLAKAAELKSDDQRIKQLLKRLP